MSFQPFLKENTDMAKLTDDPRVAEAIEKAEARGAKTELKRINSILADVGTENKETPDKVAKKAAADTLKEIKRRIREEA